MPSMTSNLFTFDSRVSPRNPTGGDLQPHRVDNAAEGPKGPIRAG